MATAIKSHAAPAALDHALLRANIVAPNDSR
jgi:hypothetical protein